MLETPNTQQLRRKKRGEIKREGQRLDSPVGHDSIYYCTGEREKNG